MKKPKQIPWRAPLSASERRILAARAEYHGSREHKLKRSWLGMPMARQLPGGKVGRRDKQTTTVCPLTTEQDRKLATTWLRKAIEAGQYRFREGDLEFPHKVWYEANGNIWFGLCINSGSGQYKGWPIDEDERRGIFD